MSNSSDGVPAAPTPTREAVTPPTSKDYKAAKKGQWIDCWICSKVFCRRRQTTFYCLDCGGGFCAGEHGVYPDLDNVGRCINCMKLKKVP
jgi:hypothetical protein